MVVPKSLSCPAVTLARKAGAELPQSVAYEQSRPTGDRLSWRCGSGSNRRIRILQTFILLPRSAQQFPKYRICKNPFAGFLPDRPSDPAHCHCVNRRNGGLKALFLTGVRA
jgi:hypothetical protein